jgi:hypothetical protein
MEGLKCFWEDIKENWVFVIIAVIGGVLYVLFKKKLILQWL